MKCIMIGEGKNDSYFSNELLPILNYKHDLFDQKSLPKEKKENAETDKLRSFIYRNDKDFLFKSEGGKGMAIKVFAKNLDFLLDLRQIRKIILMLDVDDDLNSKLTSIENGITSKNIGEKLSIYFKNADKINKEGACCIYFYEVHLIKEENKNLFEKFYLVLFDRDLEEVANKWYPDMEISQKEKIIKLAKDGEIINKFYNFLK